MLCHPYGDDQRKFTFHYELIITLYTQYIFTILKHLHFTMN